MKRQKPNRERDAMKICLIGLGSIARRHIANLRKLLGNQVSITVLRSGKGSAADEETARQIDRVCQEESQLEQRYDAIFITNPTSLHYETLLRAIKRSSFFFIEKPVFVTGREELAPFLNQGNTYYVACPLRYCNVILYLKSHIDFSSVYSIRCTASSYLPHWRPGTDYRQSYSARRDMGGGVAIDLIHEWDYLYDLIGSPLEVKSLIKKKSTLELDSDDIAVYIADYPDKVAEIHLDYFGRKEIRRIELFGREDTITADLIRQEIFWEKEGKRIDLAQERNEYQKRELSHFLDIMSGTCRSDNDLEAACRVLRIAGGSI